MVEISTEKQKRIINLVTSSLFYLDKEKEGYLNIRHYWLDRYPFNEPHKLTEKSNGNGELNIDDHSIGDHLYYDTFKFKWKVINLSELSPSRFIAYCDLDFYSSYYDENWIPGLIEMFKNTLPVFCNKQKLGSPLTPFDYSLTAEVVFTELNGCLADYLGINLYGDRLSMIINFEMTFHNQLVIRYKIPESYLSEKRKNIDKNGKYNHISKIERDIYSTYSSSNND